MALLSHQRLRKSHRRRRRPASRPAGNRPDPGKFREFWNNGVALVSLAAVLGILVYLALSR